MPARSRTKMLFARAEEMMKERLPSTPEPAARPAAAAPAAPAVAPKAPVKAPEAAAKIVVTEATVQVVTKTTQQSTQKGLENEPPTWEQRVQIRLMELDVDPGNDADRGVSKEGGD